MRVFLDDVRIPPPDVFDVIVRDADSCIEILRNCDVTYISLDHDLGANKKTGYDVACYIEEINRLEGKFKELGWYVHSSSPVGAARMKMALRNVLRWNEQAPEWFRG